MKMFNKKKIIAWVILSIILQVSGLYYLDNFVFKHSSDFQSKKMDLKKDNAKDIQVTIPNNTKGINISYDGKYLCYKENEKIYLKDTKTGTSTQVKTKKEGTILYYNWIPENDRLVLAEKIEKDGGSKIRIITYDAKDSSENYSQEICEYQKDMEVNKVSVSIFTGVYYIDIYKGGLKSTVYRLDRNNKIDKLPLETNILGNMEVIPHKDRLVYEDKLNSNFFVTSPKKKLTFNSNKKLTFIGIDRNDIIYMGELNGDKVTGITYGKVDEDTSVWKKITFDSAVCIADLYFNSNSEILINDNLTGSVKNLTTGNEIAYEGKLIQIKEDFIAVKDNDGKLIYKNLKEK